MSPGPCFSVYMPHRPVIRGCYGMPQNSSRTARFRLPNVSTGRGPMTDRGNMETAV